MAAAIWAAVVHRSRIITRTISTHQALSPFGQLGLLVESSTSRPRSDSGFRRGRGGPRERWEAKLVSAVLAEHDSVSHLLESRCTAPTSEVREALRERASRSTEDADVIERKGLAGFAAPLDSFLSVAAHDKLGNCHSLLYRQVERFGGKSTGVLPVDAHRLCEKAKSRRSPLVLANESAGFAGAQKWRASSYQADVLSQLLTIIEVTWQCPRTVRLMESCKDAT